MQSLKITFNLIILLHYQQTVIPRYNILTCKSFDLHIYKNKHSLKFVVINSGIEFSPISLSLPTIVANKDHT